MTRSALIAILDLARWAPSGDNTQPWRFEIVDDNHVIVRGFDTRTHCVYDLDGRASQIAIGALLENIVIAASNHGLRTEICRRTEAPEDKPTFDVKLSASAALDRDALVHHVQARSVQRRAMHIRPLKISEKLALESCIQGEWSVVWLEGWRTKLAAARMLLANGKLRLTMPEAYRVHRDIIAWDSQFSETKVPDRAVGLDPVSTRMMRWVMQSWSRVQFFNTYLGGTIVPRIELDLIPGLACAAHFALLAKHSLSSVDDYVAAGRAMQRFWLKATGLGLYVQPEMTPLIFCRYLREERPFSEFERAKTEAEAVARQLTRLLSHDRVHRVCVMGRIGAGPPPLARSLRVPLDRLMQ